MTYVLGYKSTPSSAKTIDEGDENFDPPSDGTRDSPQTSVLTIFNRTFSGLWQPL